MNSRNWIGSVSDLEVELQCARYNLMTLWSMRPPLPKPIPSRLRKQIADQAAEVRHLDDQLCRLDDNYNRRTNWARMERYRQDYIRWQNESAEFLAHRGAS